MTYSFFVATMCYPRVMCPGCKKPMKHSTPEALPFNEELVDITYRCQICGAETVRTIKA